MRRGAKITLWIITGAVFIVLLPLLLIIGSNIGAALLSAIFDRRPSMTEMTGNFEFHGAGWPSTMVLNKDQTFSETLDSGRGTRHQLSGHWTYDYRDNYAHITFQPFVDPREGMKKVAVSALPASNNVWNYQDCYQR